MRHSTANRVVLGIAFTHELAAKTDARAKELERPRSWVVRLALEEYFAKPKRPAQDARDGR